jgi:hypothetical protein
LLSSKSGLRRGGFRIVGQVEIVARQQIMGARRVGMACRLGRADLLLGANLEVGTLVFGHFIPPVVSRVEPTARAKRSFE